MDDFMKQQCPVMICLCLGFVEWGLHSMEGLYKKTGRWLGLFQRLSEISSSLYTTGTDSQTETELTH